MRKGTPLAARRGVKIWVWGATAASTSTTAARAAPSVLVVSSANPRVDIRIAVRRRHLLHVLHLLSRLFFLSFSRVSGFGLTLEWRNDRSCMTMLSKRLVCSTVLAPAFSQSSAPNLALRMMILHFSQPLSVLRASTVALVRGHSSAGQGAAPPRRPPQRRRGRAPWASSWRGGAEAGRGAGAAWRTWT